VFHKIIKGFIKFKFFLQRFSKLIQIKPLLKKIVCKKIVFGPLVSCSGAQEAMLRKTMKDELAISKSVARRNPKRKAKIEKKKVIYSSP